MQYLRAKYYDSSQGRFTTKDTLLGGTDKPITRNLYTYCGNNPLNYVDPSGNSWLGDRWDDVKSGVKKAASVKITPNRVVVPAVRPSAISIGALNGAIKPTWRNKSFGIGTSLGQKMLFAKQVAIKKIFCDTHTDRAKDDGVSWTSFKNSIKTGTSKIADFFRNTFGAGNSVENNVNFETELMPFPFNYLLTIKQGTNSTTQVSQSGDSSKPISVYAIGRTDDPLLSSAGLKININNFSLDVSLGLNNIGITSSYKNGNQTNAFGVKADITQLKIGFEGSTTVTNEDNSSFSEYTNVSISAWLILAYALAPSGQTNESPSYNTSPAPAFG